MIRPEEVSFAKAADALERLAFEIPPERKALMQDSVATVAIALKNAMEAVAVLTRVARDEGFMPARIGRLVDQLRPPR